jgi:hypothetical protein
MALNHATIAAQEQKDRDDANAAKRAAGDADKAQLWQKILGPADAEVKHAAAEVARLRSELDTSRQLRDRSSGEVADHKIKADCERNGGKGCRPGKGHEYNKALIRQNQAAADLRRAEADIPALEARISDAERARLAAVAALDARQGVYFEAAKAVDTRITDELIPARDDPTMSFMALQRVFDSPNGPAARFYSHLMMALLLMVELSYVLVSEYFAHASVYMARLIARTKILAAEAADQYRRKTASMFGDNTGRPFRVVPRCAARKNGNVSKNGEDGESENRDAAE